MTIVVLRKGNSVRAGRGVINLVWGNFKMQDIARSLREDSFPTNCFDPIVESLEIVSCQGAVRLFVVAIGVAPAPVVILVTAMASHREDGSGGHLMPKYFSVVLPGAQFPGLNHP